MRQHSRLVLKILAGFTILAILICTTCTSIGYLQYRAYIHKQYNDTAYQIARTFQGYFKEEELARYIELASQYKEGALTKDSLSGACATDGQITRSYGS